MFRNQSEVGLSAVTVRKAELMAQIEANLMTHQATYEKALDAYREQAVQTLYEAIDAINQGKVMGLVFHAPVPQDHSDDYRRILGMLERHVGDTIELTEAAYAKLVDDEWEWRAAWLASTASYLGSDRKTK